jgi:hypothetical protein
MSEIDLLDSNDDINYVLPGLKVIDNAFGDCDQFIQEALSKDGWGDGTAGGEVRQAIRNVKVLPIIPELTAPISWYMVSRGIMMHGKQYANEYGAEVERMESPQILHYQADQEGTSFYKPHFDHSTKHPRDFSAVLYLNTLEEGGETGFVHFRLNIKPIAGRLILFPANYMYLHEAHPPISEDKFAVVTWFKFSDEVKEHGPH